MPNTFSRLAVRSSPSSTKWMLVVVDGSDGSVQVIEDVSLGDDEHVLRHLAGRQILPRVGDLPIEGGQPDAAHRRERDGELAQLRRFDRDLAVADAQGGPKQPRAVGQCQFRPPRIGGDGGLLAERSAARAPRPEAREPVRRATSATHDRPKARRACPVTRRPVKVVSSTGGPAGGGPAAPARGQGQNENDQFARADGSCRGFSSPTCYCHLLHCHLEAGVVGQLLEVLFHGLAGNSKGNP